MFNIILRSKVPYFEVQILNECEKFFSAQFQTALLQRRLGSVEDQIRKVLVKVGFK